MRQASAISAAGGSVEPPSGRKTTPAVGLLPKDVPLLCQPPDAGKIAALGFRDVRPVEKEVTFRDVAVTRTYAQHGRGSVGERMAPASGFVLRTGGEPTVYVAGDTVFCPEVAAALDAFRPDVTVLFSGAARFASGGGPITMDAADVTAVLRHAPYTRAVVLHLEAWNHCGLSRGALAATLEQAGLLGRAELPADGVRLRFG